MAPRKKTETAERSTKRTFAGGMTVDYQPMDQEEALQIIEDVARGQANKQQADAARKWLEINGGGEVYTKYTLEVVHTYRDKPKVNIPKIVIPEQVQAANG
jgi:hypothetical protein